MADCGEQIRHGHCRDKVVFAAESERLSAISCDDVDRGTPLGLKTRTMKVVMRRAKRGRHPDHMSSYEYESE